MAPNRKHSSQESQTLVESLHLLDLQVSPPKLFRPLTEEVNQFSSAEKNQCDRGVYIIRAPHTKDPSHPSNNYWDWPEDEKEEKKEEEEEETEETKKQELIQKILEEERIRQVLSIGHLEENLCSSFKESKEVIVASQTSTTDDDDDDYWSEGNNDDVGDTKTSIPSAVPQHQSQQSYWDWPTLTPLEEKERIIQSILEEERCREVLSVENIEAAIVRQSAALVSSSSSSVVTPKPSAKSDLYWDWTISQDTGYWQWPSTVQDQKAFTIQQILMEDRVMKQFSIEYLESKLLHESSQTVGQQGKQIITTGEGESSYYYWSW